MVFCGWVLLGKFTLNVLLAPSVEYGGQWVFLVGFVLRFTKESGSLSGAHEEFQGSTSTHKTYKDNL